MFRLIYSPSLCTKVIISRDTVKREPPRLSFLNTRLSQKKKNPHRKKKKKEVNVENKCHMSERVNLI